VFGRAPLTSFGTVKMYLGYLLVVPVRILLLLPFHINMCTLISLALLGAGPNGVEGCRGVVFEWLCYVWMRGNLFLFGYYYIPTTGRKVLLGKEVSAVYIGNHCGWMEVGYMFGMYTPSFVAKSR